MMEMFIGDIVLCIISGNETLAGLLISHCNSIDI